jgi:hypothetical protein
MVAREFMDENDCAARADLLDVQSHSVGGEDVHISRSAN